jgi:hypothetical protein
MAASSAIACEIVTGEYFGSDLRRRARVALDVAIQRMTSRLAEVASQNLSSGFLRIGSLAARPGALFLAEDQGLLYWRAIIHDLGEIDHALPLAVERPHRRSRPRPKPRATIRRRRENRS